MIDVDALLEHEDLFLTQIEGYSFSWRLLTLREFKIFQALKMGAGYDEHQIHEKVFERCYLGDAKLISNSLPAGIVPSIGKVILWLSGDQDIEQTKEDLHNIRKMYPSGALVENMKSVIMAVFPSYKPEELEEWNRLELMRRFTMAENILEQRNAEYNKLDIRKITSASEAKKKRKKKIDFAKENRGLRATMGPERTEDSNLSPRQARQLDKLRKARRNMG